MKTENFKLKISSGFTLLELLIVITIIVILAVVAIIILNPGQQIGKANDAKRKQELSELRKVLDDYYNDKGCYPKPNQICYDNPGSTTNSQYCHICGRETNSPSFSPYINSLPCDPQHPTQQYLYNVSNDACSNWYQIYSDLSLGNADRDAKALNCTGGSCGLPPNYGYYYGISSSNTNLNVSSQYNCLSITNRCNVCGAYSSCLTDNGCPDKNKIYGSYQACCSANPGACQ